MAKIWDEQGVGIGSGPNPRVMSNNPIELNFWIG